MAQVQLFNVPDAKYGEAVCAWVVLKADSTCTETELRDFCTNQIAHYKIPRDVRFVDAMPMTVTGKAQKFVMRAPMMQELELAAERAA